MLRMLKKVWGKLLYIYWSVLLFWWCDLRTPIEVLGGFLVAFSVYLAAKFCEPYLDAWIEKWLEIGISFWGIKRSLRLLPGYADARYKAYFSQNRLEKVALYNQKIGKIQEIGNAYCEELLAKRFPQFVKKWILLKQAQIQSYSEQD